MTIVAPHRPPRNHPLRNGYRDLSTERLLEEAQCWRWDRAEIEADAATDLASAPYLEPSRDFIDAHLHDIAEELDRRRRLLGSPYAPPWPTTWPDRRAEITTLKAEVDLPAFVQTYTPARLRRAGAELVGLCPLHEEKTPSFSVNPTTHLWYCFGCQAGGDVITLAMGIFNLDFPAALDTLAAIAGAGRAREGATRG